ncbi:MAG: methionyl-tRNA formyltransferase [Chloroflexota bacterium]|nr:MAG: methionyl-tRNA formyltransferase [Chloroflexota bacterium]
MHVVFMGTPEFAVPSLEALVEKGYEVVGVYTRPDKPKGRGRVTAQSAVKQAALRLGLPVYQPATLKKPEQIEELAELRPELIVVAAYGLILRSAVLELPTYGCVNVHASLLPRWRGSAPIAWSILAGDNWTGNTIMLMDIGIDTGPMLSQVRIPALPEDTTATLTDKLAQLGAGLLVSTLPLWISGQLRPVPQEDEATYAPMLKPEDALIHWDTPAEEISRQVRAFQPWPGAHTYWRGKRIILFETQPRPGNTNAQPGQVLRPTDLPDELQTDPRRSAILVQTGSGLLAVKKLQMEGGRPLSADEFLRGHAALAGERLIPKE